MAESSPPREPQQRWKWQLGAAREPQRVKMVARACLGAAMALEMGDRACLGDARAPKIAVGAFLELDGALEMVAPVCIGDTGTQCARKYCSKMLSLLVCSLRHFSLMDFRVLVFWWRYGM